MKIPCLLTAALLFSGCTSMQPIKFSPAELRQRINSGELLKSGDRVSIVTTDGNAHRFAIKSIDPQLIYGRKESVPIEQVVSVRRRQFSRVKTAALVVGIGLACALIGLGAYTATHLTLAF